MVWSVVLALITLILISEAVVGDDSGAENTENEPTETFDKTYYSFDLYLDQSLLDSLKEIMGDDNFEIVDAQVFGGKINALVLRNRSHTKKLSAEDIRKENAKILKDRIELDPNYDIINFELDKEGNLKYIEIQYQKNGKTETEKILADEITIDPQYNGELTEGLLVPKVTTIKSFELAFNAGTNFRRISDFAAQYIPEWKTIQDAYANLGSPVSDFFRKWLSPQGLCKTIFETGIEQSTGHSASYGGKPALFMQAFRQPAYVRDGKTTYYYRLGAGIDPALITSERPAVISIYLKEGPEKYYLDITGNGKGDASVSLQRPLYYSSATYSEKSVSHLCMTYLGESTRLTQIGRQFLRNEWCVEIIIETSFTQAEQFEEDAPVSSTPSIDNDYCFNC